MIYDDGKIGLSYRLRQHLNPQREQRENIQFVLSAESMKLRGKMELGSKQDFNKFIRRAETTNIRFQRSKFNFCI